MGRMMAASGRQLLTDADLVVPVPLHRWRLWRRRFNQAALLARTVADTAYATNIIVGPHAGDHATIAPAHVLSTAFAGAAGVAGMRIAVSGA